MKSMWLWIVLAAIYIEHLEYLYKECTVFYIYTQRIYTSRVPIQS